MLIKFFVHHTTFVLQLQSLLQDFQQPIRVEVSSVEPADHPDKTEIVFMTLDVSQKEHLFLSADEQLDYIRLLNNSNISIQGSIIYWDSEYWSKSERTQVVGNHPAIIVV